MFDGLKKSVRGLLNKLSKVELTDEDLNPLIWEFKLNLLENDVALEVTDQIGDQVKRKLLGVEIKRFEDKHAIVFDALRATLSNILRSGRQIDLVGRLKEKSPTRMPFVIVFIGVNGTGKTTTIAKIANLIVQAGFTAVLAGSDTFRAGSIEQLEGHGKRLGLRVVKHSYGADAAAVAYDAVSHAKANGINVVLVDTAGRMQTNRNLIDQMKKIIRVAQPDLVLLVVDALTGNDAIEQGRVFDEAVGVDGIILTKLDADAKGGAAISISFATKKPIAFFGTGQEYTDIAAFDPDYILTKMGLHVDEGKAGVGR
jgi:fused signal recognition particle receptor